MTLYTVSIEIKDREGQGPAVLCSISPPPNPEDTSQAVALWLIVRDRLFQFNKEQRHAVQVEKLTQEINRVRTKERVLTHVPYDRYRTKPARQVRKGGRR